MIAVPEAIPEVVRLQLALDDALLRYGAALLLDDAQSARAWLWQALGHARRITSLLSEVSHDEA